MKNILNRIKKELLEVLPAFIFFLMMFYILLVTRSLTLKEYGIVPHASAIALIGAILVAKAILITDKFPFLNIYPRKPLIWNVLIKTIVFTVITFLFLFIEGLIHQSRKYGSFSVAVDNINTDFVWPVFWIREIWLTVLLLFYCAAVELARVVGADRVKEIFFGRSNKHRKEKT